MRENENNLSDQATEAAVLAGMLADGATAVAAARAILGPDDFTVAANRHIFAALLSLVDRGVEVDPLTLSDALTQRGELAAAGGKERIAELLDCVPDGANVAYHARIVRELAERRRLVELGATLQREAADRGVDMTEATRAAVEALLPMASADQQGGGFRAADWWHVMREIEDRARGKSLPGLTTGYPEIDDVTAGFQPGELVIVGGVAKGGKTSLALAFTRHALLERREPVAFVSAEMTGASLMERLLAAEAGVPVQRVTSGRLWDADYPRMARASGVLAGSRLFIDDAALPSLEDIRARALSLVAAQGPVKLLVVDFLQLVKYVLKGRRGDEELTAISYGLKGLAKKLGCVVLAPCQLNYKDVERRAGSRPTFADLAGSSGMMQAADCVMLTHRPAMYDSCAGDDMEIQVRGRRVPDFTATLRWDGRHMRVISPRKQPPAAGEQAA